MNVLLWNVQAVLAAAFAMSGFQKLAQAKEKPPTVTGIAPVLTPIAGW